MQVLELRTDFRQAELTRRNLVASCAPKLREAFYLLALLRRALLVWHLDDDSHRCQHVDASFKTLRPFLAPRGEAQLAIATNGVAALTTVRVEHVLSQFLLIFTRGDHSVQRGARL